MIFFGEYQHAIDEKGRLTLPARFRDGLGSKCVLAKGSLLEKVYGTGRIAERHRHRYEFNAAYKGKLEAAGLKISGVSPDGKLIEAVELPSNGFFAGVVFQPQFKSRPNRAHPLFREFLKAALK